MFIRPEVSESNFVLNGNGSFVEFINNILLKNLGNLVQRTLSFAFQMRNKHNIDSIIVNGDKKECNTSDIIKLVSEELIMMHETYISKMNLYKL